MERVEVDATGQAHVVGEAELPRAVVIVGDPPNTYAYLETDPWVVENVLYGPVRIPRPSAFVQAALTGST